MLAEKGYDKEDSGSASGTRMSQAAYTTECVIRHARYCPFNHRTEMFMIGYSDGGGLSIYMNYMHPMVTKAIAIDFWAYAAYDAWLPSGYGSSIDMKIFSACESSMFDWGPAALVPESSVSPATTYIEGAGIANLTYLGSTSYNFDASASITFEEYQSEDCVEEKRVHLAVHGLSGSVVGADPVPLADDASWQACSNDALASAGDPHSLMFNYVPVFAELAAWESGGDWSHCRRSRELKTKTMTSDMAFRSNFEFEAKQKVRKEPSKMSKEEYAEKVPYDYAKFKFEPPTSTNAVSSPTRGKGVFTDSLGTLNQEYAADKTTGLVPIVKSTTCVKIMGQRKYTCSA